MFEKSINLLRDQTHQDIPYALQGAVVVPNMSEHCAETGRILLKSFCEVAGILFHIVVKNKMIESIEDTGSPLDFFRELQDNIHKKDEIEYPFESWFCDACEAGKTSWSYPFSLFKPATNCSDCNHGDSIVLNALKMFLDSAYVPSEDILVFLAESWILIFIYERLIPDMPPGGDTSTVFNIDRVAMAQLLHAGDFLHVGSEHVRKSSMLLSKQIESAKLKQRVQAFCQKKIENDPNWFVGRSRRERAIHIGTALKIRSPKSGRQKTIENLLGELYPAWPPEAP